MASPDGALLLPDDSSDPQRIFEGDLVVPLMSPWLDLSDLCHHRAMQSMAWHVPESELRELPPAAISALGVKFET